MLSVGLSSPHALPHPAPVPLLNCSTPACPELDLSLPLSPNPKTSQARHDANLPSRQDFPLSNSIHPKAKPKLQPNARPTNRTHPKPRTQLHQVVNPTRSNPRPRRGKHRQQNSEDPLVVTVTAEPSHLPSNASVYRHPASEGKHRGYRHAKGRRSDPPPNAVDEEPVGLLAGAELNSTLAMKAELQQLQGAEFNSQKALQETLEKSSTAKNEINARVSEGVNVPPSQQLYRALISISVEEELLISQTIRDRLLLVPPTRSQGNKLEREGPDLFHFYKADQLREKPLLIGERLSTPHLLPSVRPAHSTFDLYRRHARWQAGP